MKDGEIKGTGNSRFMRSPNMPDTYEEFKALLESGIFPFDLNGINPDGWKIIPDWLNKANLLSDSVCDLIGIPRTSVPNDALRVLAIPEGKAAVFITVKEPSGKKIPNIIVKGVTNRQGGSATTDSNGFVIGFTSSTSTTISVDTSYVNVSGYPKTISTPTGSINSAILTINLINEVTISSSQNVKFSPQVKSVDVHVSGGGYDYRSSTSDRYKGGKQGYATNISIAPNKSYSAIVGAASSPSSFLGITPTLSGGEFHTEGQDDNNPDCTVGKYGYGPVAAGGAGGACGYSGSYGPYRPGGRGGNPHGGAGGEYGENGHDATGYGGGGGQAGKDEKFSGKGYQGVVFIKMNY